MEIKIREAGPADAPLIGRVVAMGIGYDEAKDYAGDNVFEVLAEVAAQDDSQYSYRNALIAEVDGTPAAAIVSYDGADLHTLREGSLRVIRRYHPDILITDDETDPDEYYLDSLAVLPTYRGIGIGTKLIEEAIARARSKGHTRIGLLVDYANPDAERLYRQLGFRRIGDRPFFGHSMKHMVLQFEK